MAFTLKYLGSQVESTLDNNIVVANCVAETGDSLIIFAGGLDAAGSPVATFGNVAVGEKDWRIAPTSRLSGGIWYKNTVWNGRTGDVVVTFGTNIVRRYCFVYAISNGGRFDLVKRNVQDTATTQARTLTSDALDKNNEQILSYHLTLGPSTDAVGTFVGDTLPLHRIGTSIDANDITIQTGQKVVIPLDGESSDLNITTARQALSALIAIKPTVVPLALDQEGSELEIGDTVTFEGVQSTISSFIYNQGIPTVVVVLADGRQTYSYYLDLVE